MKKIIALILVGILAFSFILTGCGNTDETAISTTPSEDATLVSNTTEAAKPAEPVKLKFMHWWSYVTDDSLKAFKNENPNFTIDMTYTAVDSYANKLKMLAASNELPDVFGVQSGFDIFAKQKQLLNLNEIVKTPAYNADTPLIDTIQPALIESSKSSLPEELKSGDQLYGLPFGAISIAVIYNKTIFNKVGITAPTTWDEYLSNCEKLKQAGYIPQSFVGKAWGDWWAWLALDQTIRASQADWDSGKVKISDSGYSDGLKIVKNMWDKGYFDPGGFSNGIEETQALFVQGKLAQFLTVPENFVTYLIENSPKDVELDAFPLPSMKGLPVRGLGGASNILSIGAATKNQEAAVKFTKFLMSEGYFQVLSTQGVVPPLKGYTPPADKPIMKAFADAIGSGFIPNYARPTDVGNKIYNKFVTELYPEMLLNNTAPEKIANELYDYYVKEVKDKK